MQERIEERGIRLLARWVSALLGEPGPTDVVLRVLSTLESARELIADVQVAMWHFTVLPSRRDVRLLMRRTAVLQRKLARVEDAIARLESAADRHPTFDSVRERVHPSERHDSALP